MLRLLWLTLTLLACSASSSLARPSEYKHDTSQPVLKTLGQEIGSPSELAWQAWLLVESKGGISSALDSSNILRRITPKSIFIAPELISCPSGYSTDGKGTCRPDPISIDEDAQKQFILKRLNALYGKFGSNKKKPEPPQGPLQINIPISVPAKNPQPAEPIPVLVSQQPILVGDNKSEEAVAVVVYKVENDTKKDESSESFLLGNANASKKVAEIIVEANDTFTGVVDYKIPLRPNATNLQQQTDKKVNGESSEDSSPTVVLLLSATKLPVTTDKPKEIVSTESETKMTETTALPTTMDESKFETIQTVAPLELQTDVDTTIRTTERTLSTRSQDDYEHQDQQMTTTTSAPSTIDDETAYTDEDETQTPEQESENEEEEEQVEEEEYEDEFVEDELLKPGEAGSMMSVKNQELIRSKIHHTSTLPVVSTTTMLQQDTTTMPPTIQDIYDAKESTIRAEVTGFTTQTTDVPSTIVNTLPEDITTITTTTTTVTPRPQRVKATIQINPYTPPIRRQPTTTTTTTTIRVTENPTEPPPTFFLQRQPQRQQQQQQQRKPSMTVNDERIYFKDDRRDNNNLPPEFKDQLSRDRTYVRFPDAPQHPRAGSYVRFPSDEVNSIHNQDSLKDLSPFQYSSSTKSSVQRWRQQKQKPMLLRFWARMPLVRDLTFYPTTSHGSHNEPIGGTTPPTARRGNGAGVGADSSTIFKSDA